MENRKFSITHEFNLHRIFLVHQNGRLFIVLVNQHDRHDVMIERSIGARFSAQRILELFDGYLWIYHPSIITNVCFDKRSQKSLHRKLVLILPIVCGVAHEK